MNNNRKEIINLIQDYMDKTLSEWCLVCNEDWYFILDKCTFFETVRWEPIYLLSEWYKKKWIKWDEIIGHYDITALFSFIYEQWYYVFYNWRWEFRICDVDNNTQGFFQNKPLHLYTEQEEILLLNLLLKLK